MVRSGNSGPSSSDLAILKEGWDSLHSKVDLLIVTLFIQKVTNGNFSSFNLSMKILNDIEYFNRFWEAFCETL